jgi:hypothetical protein
MSIPVDKGEAEHAGVNGRQHLPSALVKILYTARV